MPLFNFKSQFADDVEALIKRQTIRAPRKDGRDPEVGQIAHCYTGLRTAKSRLLGRWPITHVEEVMIASNGVTMFMGTINENSITDGPSLENFAQADGFDDWPAMRDWFEKTHGFPFTGFLSKW